MSALLVQAQDWPGTYAILAALCVALLVILVIALRRAKKSNHLGAVFTAVTFLIALALNAEGMYFVATRKMHLSREGALGVFAVFELFQINFMIKAAAHYKEHKRPGLYAWGVWGIAVASGVLVAANSTNNVERAARIILPLAVAATWHINLIAAGVKRNVGKFRYSPHRVMVTLGLIEPEGDVDYDKISRDRKIRRIVTLRHKISRGGKLEGWRRYRLDRILNGARSEDLDAAVEQVQSVVEARAKLGLGEIHVGEEQAKIGSVPEQVQERGTAGTGLVPAAGTGSFLGSGTGNGNGFDLDSYVGGNGSGQERTDPGTQEPDEVLIQAILLRYEQTGVFPTVMDCKSICAKPGFASCSTDRASAMRRAALARLDFADTTSPSGSVVDGEVVSD